jgi:hypothetical protein
MSVITTIGHPSWQHFFATTRRHLNRFPLMWEEAFPIMRTKSFIWLRASNRSRLPRETAGSERIQQIQFHRSAHRNARPVGDVQRPRADRCAAQRAGQARSRELAYPSARAEISAETAVGVGTFSIELSRCPGDRLTVFIVISEKHRIGVARFLLQCRPPCRRHFGGACYALFRWALQVAR